MKRMQITDITVREVNDSITKNEYIRKTED